MKSSDPRIGYFDSLAGDWDNQEPSAQTMTARLGEHADLLALRRGQALLEVGCGTGKTTAWLARQVAPARVPVRGLDAPWAIDFAPEMIARAKAKGVDADFACLDVCRDALGLERYDVVLCFHCFPHFRDQPFALRNFARALKPAGRLLVMHLAGSGQINCIHAGIDGPVRGDTLPIGEQWSPLLAAAGLRQTRQIDREVLFFLEAGLDPRRS